MKPWKTRPEAASSNSSKVGSSGFARRPLHRGAVGVGVGHAIGDGEQPVDDGAFVAHAEVAGQHDHRPVRELHLPVGVGEEDAVDGRVEHGAQDVGKPLEVVVLGRQRALRCRERARHLVECRRERAHLARASFRHLHVLFPVGDPRVPGDDPPQRQDRPPEDIGDHQREEHDGDRDAGDAACSPRCSACRHARARASATRCCDAMNGSTRALIRSTRRLPSPVAILARALVDGSRDERDRPVAEVDAPGRVDPPRLLAGRGRHQLARLRRQRPARRAPRLEERPDRA